MILGCKLKNPRLISSEYLFFGFYPRISDNYILSNPSKFF